MYLNNEILKNIFYLKKRNLRCIVKLKSKNLKNYSDNKYRKKCSFSIFVKNLFPKTLKRFEKISFYTYRGYNLNNFNIPHHPRTDNPNN